MDQDGLGSVLYHWSTVWAYPNGSGEERLLGLFLMKSCTEYCLSQVVMQMFFPRLVLLIFQLRAQLSSLVLYLDTPPNPKQWASAASGAYLEAPMLATK